VNDLAPIAYNDHELPSYLPTSPLDPAPSPIGFQWEQQ